MRNGCEAKFMHGCMCVYLCACVFESPFSQHWTNCKQMSPSDKQCHSCEVLRETMSNHFVDIFFYLEAGNGLQQEEHLAT